MSEDFLPVRLSSIQRTSRRIAIIATIAFWGLLPAIIAYVLLLPEQLPYISGVALAQFKPRDLPILANLAVICALAVCASPGMWGLWHLRRLFQGYAQGRIFTVEAAGRLRHCAWALLVSGAMGPLGVSALSLALSIGLAPGSRALVVGVSSNDLAMVLIGLIFLVIARIMGEAAHIAEDNAGFI